LACSYLQYSFVTMSGSGRQAIQVTNKGNLPLSGQPGVSYTLSYVGYQGTPPSPLTFITVPLVTDQNGNFSYQILDAFPSATYVLYLSSTSASGTTAYAQLATTATGNDQTVTTANTANQTANTANTTASTALTNANVANNQLASIANSGIITDQERTGLNAWLATCLQQYNSAVFAATGILNASYLSIQASAWNSLYSYFSNIIITLAGTGNYTLPANGSITGIQVWQQNVSALSQISITILTALAQSPASATSLGVVKAGSGVVVNVNGVLTVESAYNATYTATLGDGYTTIFTVTHGLDTEAIFYNLWETSGSNWVTADATVTITGLNTVTVGFNTAPAVGAITIIIISSAVITGVGGSQTLPSQTGYGNDFLQTTGTAMQWVPISQVPSCIGYANAVLSSNGTAYYWTNALTSSAGIVSTLSAAGLEIPAICSSLPTLPNSAFPNGCIITLSSNGQIYSNNNNVWVTATSTSLTGLTTGTNTAITATNSILTAFQNLQAQVTYMASQISTINTEVYNLQNPHEGGGGGGD
jgi:hypothetical protein